METVTRDDLFHAVKWAVENDIMPDTTIFVELNLPDDDGRCTRRA